MWNAKENREIRQGEGVVAVAVYNGKSSQYALKWAVENLFPRDKPLKLVHVVKRPLSPKPPLNPEHNTLVQQERDTQAIEVFLPYRCFCSRRRVQFETVTLYDSDVARALINFVSVSRVETLLLGSSRNSISRILKNSDIQSSVLKWAPDHCNIYIISKGKVSTTRPASRSAPTIPANQTTQPINSVAVYEMLYDELSLSVVENENSLGGPGRVSTDSNCLSFYENLGRGFTSTIKSSHLDDAYMEDEDPIILSSNDIKHFSSTETPSLMSLHTQENVEDEVRRLKIELKQTTDMYHAACREALVSKEKWNELEEWKMEQERRMKDVEAAAMAEVEKEKARYKEAIEAAQRFAAEVEKRILKAEIKATTEAEEKQRVLDALGRSHSVLKDHGLFHIFAVVVLFYLYFSLFN